MERLQTKLTRNRLMVFLLAVTVLFALPVAVFAGSQSVPYSFSSGTAASASQVNSNFSHFRTRAFDLSGSNIYYNNGFVGIYTSTVTDPLHVRADSGGDNIHLEEYSGGEDWQIGVDSGGDLNFEDEGIIRVTFGDGGRVGIGDSTPNFLLDVENTTSLTTTIYGYAYDGTNYAYSEITGGTFGLRATVNGDNHYGGWFRAYGDNGYGAYSYANGSNSIGVYGSGTKYGLQGFSSNSYSAGVYGENNSSNSYGVYGKGPTGVYAHSAPSSGNGHGTYSWVRPSSGHGYGVFTYASPTGGGRGYGGYLQGYSPSGWHAYGLWAGAYPTNSTAYGGYFTADPSTAGAAYGVYARAYPVTGYTGFDFYAAGAGTDYGPFTGAHEVKLEAAFPEDARPGLIVSATGETEKRSTRGGDTSLSSTLPTVRMSSSANDKAVLGVLVTEGELHEEHWYAGAEGERFAIVNALGEGRVWVSDINGDIEAGDYITTSVIPGYGQLQDDDLQHSYTLGKAIETVDWASVTETVEIDGNLYKVYLIAVVYTSG